MKRILLLTPFYKPFIGGAERFAEEFIARRPPSVELMVFTARIVRSLPKREIENGVIIYRLGLGCAYDKFLFPFLAAGKALGRPYDCVYAVMASYAGAAAFFIHALKRTPYVLNLQSGTLDTPQYGRVIRFIFPLYRAIHRSAWKIHAVSGSLRARALSLGVLENKITLIPNGIDCARYADKGIARIPFRIIVVARLENTKGVRYAIEAMEYIIPRFPEAELRIAGDGSERHTLEALVRAKNLVGRVFFMGFISPMRVFALLTTGTVFICPSLAEGFGIAVLEAMASGCVVVATDVGGIPDIVHNGKNGILVSPRNPLALVSAVLRLWEDNALRERLVATGKITAREYDWQDIMPRVFSSLQ